MTNSARKISSRRQQVLLKSWRWVAIFTLFTLAGCGGLTKVDYTTFGRGGWQRPDDVITALGLRPGDRVADLGAGEGYFIPYLSEAVGANGRVYAVDIDPEQTVLLKERFSNGNVEVVLGAENDPKLPAAVLDVVLLVNTYHHIETRLDYFERLRGNLRPGGRVVVIEPNADLGGLLSMALDEGHMSHAKDVAREMQLAGYQLSQSLDFLPVQIFEIFAPVDG